MIKILQTTLLLGLLFILSGCNQTSIQMVKLKTTSLNERQLQTKSYDTTNESEILSSSVATLQDMGFNIDEINRDFGVITCSKTRDAREVGQQVGLFFLALFAGANVMDSADHTQNIRATVVVTPKEKLNKKTDVRLTVMRVLRNHKGMVTGVENIKDKSIYQQFFDKLSKSVFLEENKV